MGASKAFNGNGKTPGDLARELFDSYRKNKQTQRKMGEVIVGLFEESWGFVSAKRHMEYLEELEVWEPSFSTRIRAAVQNNNQVSGSFGVAKRVEALINKWAKSGV